ncbi:MAG: hypothetical protein IJ240_10205 [Clostridia bacterium]|nr:hypothetical protein [Clostridia bacterium]
MTKNSIRSKLEEKGITQEWFTYNIFKVREVMFAPLSDDDWSDTFRRIKEIGDTIEKITGMSRDEIADLFTDKLLVSETERQAFFKKYSVPSEFENICKQVLAFA